MKSGASDGVEPGLERRWRERPPCCCCLCVSLAFRFGSASGPGEGRRLQPPPPRWPGGEEEPVSAARLFPLDRTPGRQPAVARPAAEEGRGGGRSGKPPRHTARHQPDAGLPARQHSASRAGLFPESPSVLSRSTPKSSEVNRKPTHPPQALKNKSGLTGVRIDCWVFSILSHRNSPV